MPDRINVTRSSMPYFEEYCKEIRDLWDSRWLTNNGSKLKKLEDKLRAYLKMPHVTMFANGHLALESALLSLNLEKGSEVITTPFTFASTTHAIVRAGLVPVFCDIRESDFTVDPEKIESLITERTKAILPVHVYGNVCDVDSIAEIAKKHELKVVYDAAHSFGETYKGMSTASFGDLSMFSFHATKVFHTVEGGAVCTESADICERLESMRNFGLNGQEDCNFPAGNAKMSEFHAAMGLCNLKYVEEQIALRKRAAFCYRRYLTGVEGILLPEENPDISYNYGYFPVLFDPSRFSRDTVHKKLAENNVFARKYFYPLTSSFRCYQDCLGADPDSLPVAMKTAERVLTLPLYAELGEKDVERICRIILSR